MTGPGDGEPDSLLSGGSDLIAGITELREFAMNTAAAAAALPTDADGLRSRLIDKAQEVVALAQDPITIGVVGQFSSGKSLLLGLLVGKPDLLPVKDRSLTVNVTALHLANSPAGSQTTLTRAQIYYLTDGELVECVEHMLEVLAMRVVAAGLNPEPLRGIAATRPLDRLWPALQDWCRAEAWPRAEVRLNLLVGELMRLNAAAVAAPALLGWSPTMKPELIDRALQLPASDVITDPRTFPEPILPIVDVNHRGGEPSAEQLSATLPLVKRITLDIGVPSDIWNLSGLRGENEMVLLDFPGFGVKTSGVREYYLSRRALKDVTTILVVINAQAGGSDVPREFPMMMGRTPAELRDRVLAVVGRFDQLPDYVRPELYASEWVGPPITDRTLTDGPLRTVMSDARDLVGLGRDDRVAFHSAMVGIDDLDTRFPGRENYSMEFRMRSRLDGHVPRASEMAYMWRKVADRLAVDDPSSYLRHSLAEFGRDGGVAHIRQLLERHVRSPGLRYRYDDLVRRVDELERLRDELVQFGQDSLMVAARASARAPMESLLSDVRLTLSELCDRAAVELSDPARVMVGPGISLAGAVTEHAVNEVFSWPEWGQLFAAVEGGIVELPGSGDNGIDIPWRRRANRVGLPTSSDDFSMRFQEAAEACEQAAFELTWAALDAWVSGSARTVRTLREKYDEIVTREARARLEEILGDEDRWSPALLAALDLNWITPVVRRGVDRYLSRSRLTQRAAVFPLRSGCWFAWHPDIPEDARRTMDAAAFRHQMRVARLRRELVVALADAVLFRVGLVQNGIASLVQRALKAPLNELVGVDVFIDALLGDLSGHVEEPFAALRAVTRPTAR